MRTTTELVAGGSADLGRKVREGVEACWKGEGRAREGAANAHVQGSSSISLGPVQHVGAQVGLQVKLGGTAHAAKVKQTPVPARQG